MSKKISQDPQVDLLGRVIFRLAVTISLLCVMIIAGLIWLIIKG